MSSSTRLQNLFVIVSLLWIPLSDASGTARLIEPTMRSSLWRFDPIAPVNLNDHSLDCGGPQIQTNLNGGRCGVCGDPYNAERDNERGGKYDAGIVARRYRTGSKVTMVADLVSGNGGGYFEVKLCPRNNPRGRVTQACFDRYPLKITNGRNKRLWVPKNSRNPSGLYRLDVKLPKGVACTNCVIQWHYQAANEWGYDSSGRGCMGCGPQTEIYNCADVTIGYYGDAESKAGPSPDLSTGPLAARIDIYANGEFATGVSPVVMNSGNSQGWASANELSGRRVEMSDQDEDKLMPRFGQRSAGFVNLFNGDNNMMYDTEGDFGFNAMMSVFGAMTGGAGGEGGGGESGESNFGMSFSNGNQRMMRSFGGGGSSDSSEEGGRFTARNNAMNIPSISRQYRRLNVGTARNTGGSSESSGSSEERGPRVNIGNNRRNLQKLQDALRDIANRQNLRKGLEDILKKIQDDNNDNINDYNDYYNDPNPEETTPPDYYPEEEYVVEEEEVPVYEDAIATTPPPDDFFREGGNRGDGDSYYYTDGLGDGDGTGPDYGGQGGDYYDAYGPDGNNGNDIDNINYDNMNNNDNNNNNNNNNNNAMPYPEPEGSDGGAYTGPNTGGSYDNNGNNVNEYPDNTANDNGYDNNNMGNPIGQGGEEAVGPGGDYPDYYNDYGNNPTGGNNNYDVYGSLDQYYDESGNPVDLNDFYDTDDVDYRGGGQESMEEMDEDADRRRVRPTRPRPSPLGNWPFNYQLGLMAPQYMNGLWANNMNPALLAAAKQYGPWQMSNALSPLNPQTNIIPQTPRLSRTSPAYGQNGGQVLPSPPNRLFSWMPSAQSVMSMGATKSPIFSQKVANHYMSPFLSLSQSHPALRCQRPDQLVCVATANYRNIPNADNICTTKCRAGGACGSDYCSCACQKSLMCVHMSSQNAAGFTVTELDMWCTNQCNAGQCPNQVCACSVVF